MNEQPMSVRMQRVADWLKANLEGHITIAEAAAIAVMSERNLLRRFRAEIGISPSEYLMNARLVRAQEMLLQTGLPADSIARRCGLTDGTRLSRLFRERIGSTPTEYRRSAR
ncbi:TPA: helix-turn-helix domain-containing protein [Burkholderia contaminans]|uniref:helix-turn-helix domain-containing protein n=1 Tax=Burkholderia contaminans TaxID=488447 RepID=UPI00158CECA2|nr:helix-turn-helix domain-containing protein [Burkholderia contaminans]MBM6427938.1 helix-turn-helix domain-containing protein [Burkholderia contaminans]MCA7876769.1 helix-turn-helix domain-containing protein [Burkholderia contaminans]MDN8024208.1 helix-turn-helix domain-containing protein [Burkholderia contaminans]HDR9065499.1 helix-turn-helix domain-containing protein [Burkholderia vietnamiensis]